MERELILNPEGPLFRNFQIQQISSINTDLSSHSPEITNLDIVARDHIQKVLHKTKGQINGSGGAAELLGINANTLRNRMNKLGIKYRKKEYP